MRSLTCLVRHEQIVAMTYQLTDRLHAGRTVRVSADGISVHTPADCLSVDIAIAA